MHVEPTQVLSYNPFSERNGECSKFCGVKVVENEIIWEEKCYSSDFHSAFTSDYTEKKLSRYLPLVFEDSVIYIKSPGSVYMSWIHTACIWMPRSVPESFKCVCDLVKSCKESTDCTNFWRSAFTQSCDIRALTVSWNLQGTFRKCHRTDVLYYCKCIIGTIWRACISGKTEVSQQHRTNRNWAGNSTTWANACQFHIPAQTVQFYYIFMSLL